MNILITGCAGFIGSHVAEKLLALGHCVIGIDNFDSFYDPKIKEENIRPATSLPAFELHRGDIRDSNLLRNIFAKCSIDLVIHLAARAGVRPSIEQPMLYYEVNVQGTLVILEMMKEFHVKKLVFASSSSVYGNNVVPFREADPVDHPISPYAATKKAGELICFTYYKLHGIQSYCLRFFTAYGPRQRPEMAITMFARSIIAREKITLFAHGKSSRDYTYIDDIVAGVVSAAERVNGYEIINLGESSPTQLIELLHKLEDSLDLTAHYDLLPGQPGDVDVTYADITKAKTLLNYSANFPLERGIKHFVEWYKKAHA